MGTNTFKQKFPALFSGSQDKLDDLVHDLKSQEASAINNEGVEAQIAFIVESLGEAEAEKEIGKLLAAE